VIPFFEMLKFKITSISLLSSSVLHDEIKHLIAFISIMSEIR